MTRTWTMKNGNTIEISRMDDGHLVNTIGMLERNADKAAKQAVKLGADPADWSAEELFKPQYTWLKEELEMRIKTGRMKRGLGPTYKGANKNKEEPDDSAIRFSLLELDE